MTYREMFERNIDEKPLDKLDQKERVFKYLKEHKVIDDTTSAIKLKVKRLSARIHDLRQIGDDIQTQYKEGTNEYGKYKYAVYILHYRKEIKDE